MGGCEKNGDCFFFRERKKKRGFRRFSRSKRLKTRAAVSFGQGKIASRQDEAKRETRPVKGSRRGGANREDDGYALSRFVEAKERDECDDDER